MLVVSDIAAIIVIAVGILVLHKRIEREIERLRGYRMDIVVSIIFLAFIALLVYASIDATKHPK